MYYSLTFTDGNFNDKNTYDDWYLVPIERPSFQPPTFTANNVTIPGRDGLLDVSTALKGYPTYENRTGSIEFLIYESPYTWYETYTMVMNYLHGQKRKVYLEDDPAYIYEGRFSIDSFKSKEHYSTITIKYDLQPYKMSRWSTIERWEWDPFDFQNGVILRDWYLNLVVASDESGSSPIDTYKRIFDSSLIDARYRQEAIGRLTVCPTFKVNSYDQNGLDILFKNTELGINEEKHLDDGDIKVPDFIFSMQHPDNIVSVDAKGWGILSIEFYIGNL